MILISETSHPKVNRYLDYASEYLLYYIAFTLPYAVHINSIGIILFAVSVLFRHGVVGIYKKLTPLSYLFISLYLIHVIGMLYTSNTKAGGFDLEKKLALIIFPLFMSAISLDKKSIHRILFVFACSCLILMLYFLLVAGLRYYLFDTTEYFFVHITHPLGIHRVYFAMYMLLGIVICQYLYQDKWISSKLFILFAIFIFSLGIFLVSARMCFLIYLVLVIRYLYMYIVRYKNYKIAFAIIAIGLVAMSFIITNPKMTGKLSETYTDLDKGNSKRNTSSANLRVIKWKCGWEVFTDNKWIGVGTGDAVDALVESYTKNNFFWGMLHKYNAHNQYMEIAIAVGLTGLLIWLLCLGVPFMLAIRYQQSLLIDFIIIFGMCCLTESMLNAQKGVVFYAFFNSLLGIQLLRCKVAQTDKIK